MTDHQITIAAAYQKGRRCSGDDMQDSMQRFIKKYCQHGPWAPFCDLCTAWHNGFDNQLEQDRHEHAKRCAKGYADRMNHSDCA